ncbi:gamma subclass chorismate mutase AroQ [Streptomyces gamaensis]|uniref:chorismate mutase n=1 Tax=Streptomyces gamaensis TaxID=1763542 RepID=A0ABW0Z074_9ACTN
MESTRAFGVLARLAARRVLTADRVAAAKWVSGRSIDDPARERQVLDAVDVRARELGIDRADARRIIGDQIEASKLVQRRLHEHWRNNPREAPTAGPDLGRVREEISRIDAELLTALRRARPVPAAAGAAGACARTRADVAGELLLGDPYRQGLRRALRGLCGTRDPGASPDGR